MKGAELDERAQDLNVAISEILYAGGHDRPDELIVAEIKKALVDAYRAGMTEAAAEVRLLSPGTKSEERAIAFEEAITAILEARDRKTGEGT
ncbi:MAG TPA: hypothetical protein VFU31_20925 [Candidatus Binatia bacterium]|nr:hypothetical protein [Candidatus Binatia bacterium]